MKRKLSSLLIVCLVVFAISAKEKTPQRIVSLSPAATEILFAVGAEKQIAARTDLCDFPSECKNLPSVGGFDGKTLSMESILSFRPDFVYLTDGMHNFFIEQLEKYGIRYYLSKSNSIESVKNEILDIAKITGHEKNGKKIVEKIDSAIKSIYHENENHKKVYWEVWNAPYMSAGRTSFINDIIKYSNGENIFSDIEQAYPSVSEETIINRSPDVILIPLSSGITVEMVKARKGWASIPAVKNNQIYLIDDNIFTRAGPRVVESIQTFSKLINEK